MEEADGWKYAYDAEGNLLEKSKLNGERWQYQWNANGSLKQVTRPDKKVVGFEYDALGRRTAKIFKENITRWVWDGNTPLHEWSYPLADRPQEIKDFMGFRSKDREEPVNNPITWVFEEGTFRPAAKLTEKGAYSIITDYLGTPVEMYNKYGEKTWETRLDIYGKVASFEGGKYESSSISDCPFRYQGQYEDSETGLYYNRFRYYSPDEGIYISQDPIGLEGGNPTLYGYVQDVNSWVDVFGLDCGKIKPEVHFHGTEKPRVTGATPNSVYSHVDPKTGKVLQNSIYDANGNAVGHVDFKNHGIESGHWHEFPEPGNPASGHGAGKPHHPHSTVPEGWDIIPDGMLPHTPIGT